MRTFNTVWNIVYLCFGVFSILLGLVIILGAALTQDGSSIFYGVILLLLGGFRIFWSIYRMRAYARFNAAQNAQMRQGYNPYAPPPGMYPPQQPYGAPYPPQQPQYGGQYAPPGQYGPYGQQPGQPAQPSAPIGAYPPQPGQYTGQYPPQPGQYTGEYPPRPPIVYPKP